MTKRKSSVSDNEFDGVGEVPETEAPDEEAVAEPGPASVSPDAERDRLEKALTTERDKHLRLAAEFDNFRKRSLKERQEAGARAQADLVQGLIEVLDDIMRFAHLDPTTVDSNTVVQGVAMVERKIMKTLSGQGLEIIDPAGQPFNPSFHEAVATEPATSEDEDHMVARVDQPGFLFRGQLLRPARVVVKQWLS